MTDLVFIVVTQTNLYISNIHFDQDHHTYTLHTLQYTVDRILLHNALHIVAAPYSSLSQSTFGTLGVGTRHHPRTLPPVSPHLIMS